MKEKTKETVMMFGLSGVILGVGLAGAVLTLIVWLAFELLLALLLWGAYGLFYEQNDWPVIGYWSWLLCVLVASFLHSVWKDK